jgi:peptidoglycan/xylan/chitin deacetylase (PgdA/CDA1 family)
VLVENALKYPELIQREIREGHEVALHGLNHRSWTKMNKHRTRRDLGEALKILKDQFQVIPKHYRPAYGTVTPHNFKFCVENNMKLTLWTCIVTDWKGRLKGKAGTILNETRNRSVILCMHDGYKSKIHSGSTLEILKIILPVLKTTHEFELLK